MTTTSDQMSQIESDHTIRHSANGHGIRLRKDELPIQTDWFALHRDLSASIRSAFAATECPKILEAGCGRRWSLDLQDLNPYIVGLDVDEEALRLRVVEKKDLDEYILGDLDTTDFPDRSFDMIYCSYVLEHIEKANELLSRMSKWLRPDGLLVVKIPLRDSAFGWLTRATPMPIHVLYHRLVLGLPDAGKPGHSPYPVYYDRVISLGGMQEFLDRQNMEVLFATATDFSAGKHPIVKAMIRSIASATSIASLGKLTSRFSGIAFVARKN